MGTSGSKGVAIVTGASRGLGRATALALSDAGYNVAALGRDRVALHLLLEEIRNRGGESWGGKTLWVDTDVRNYHSIGIGVDQAEGNLGPVDVLVNNAGVVHPRKPVQEIRHPDFDEAFETHFTGPLGFIEKVLPGMLERNSGVIVNVASKSARYAVPGFAAYNASKAALVSLTQTLAKEVRGTGIRVYSISPGGMSTGMREAAYGEEDAAKQQNPEFVAHVIADIVRLGAIPTFGVETEHRFFPRSGPVQNRPDYANSVPSGADVLVWRGEVEVFPMEDRV